MATLDYYRNKWEQYKARGGSLDFEEFAQEVAMTFLDRYYYNDRFKAEYIDILCEMSTEEARDMSAIGSSALFGIVVESLCDDFEELQSEAYNRLMSRIISYCRNLPAGERLNERMKRFGLEKFEDIYDRAERLRKTSCERRVIGDDIQKVLFLSRVTIGADVAVTSVLVQRAARAFPDAELVVLGGGKTRSLFADNSRVRIRNVDYVRRGALMDRLVSWFNVLDAVDGEIENCVSGQCLVIDTDSRLSQLGVLPVTDDSAYLFFNSRSSFSNDPRLSIAEMANRWFNLVVGSEGFSHSSVWLDSKLRDRTSKATVSLRKGLHGRKLVAVNLGVGGNTRKRVGIRFEVEMVLEILKEPDTVVLLDKGFGPDELEQVKGIIAAARDAGYTCADIEFNEFADSDSLDAKLIAIQAEIDEVAALIGSCDEFIGYDSACQHIAAALDIPAYTIFAGSNNTRFVRRWRPFGSGKTEIIHVDTLTYPPVANTQNIIHRLMHLRRGES